MIWGIKDGLRVRATPNEKASCELCYGELIAKCGEIKIWHFAHKSNIECDDWYEPESEWHLNWKNEFPPEQQEVKIGRHIADIRTRTNMIIELQSSSISPKTIKEREDYYQNMIWILNGEKFAKNLELRKKAGYYSFRWKYPIKSFWKANRPMFIDLKGDFLFLVNKIYHEIPCGGWGTLYSKESFLQLYGDLFKQGVKNGKTKDIL